MEKKEKKENHAEPQTVYTQLKQSTSKREKGASNPQKVGIDS